MVNGDNPYEGRVQVYHDGTWQTVCDDGWGIEEATVVCMQLGYSTATAAPGSAYYGEGTGTILLDDLVCNGYESSLLNCPHRGINSHNCDLDEAASVKCKSLNSLTLFTCKA